MGLYIDFNMYLDENGNFWSMILDPITQEASQALSKVEIPPMEFEVIFPPKTIKVLYVTAGILAVGMIGAAVINSRRKK